MRRRSMMFELMFISLSIRHQRMMMENDSPSTTRQTARDELPESFTKHRRTDSGASRRSDSPFHVTPFGSPVRLPQPRAAISHSRASSSSSFQSHVDDNYYDNSSDRPEESISKRRKHRDASLEQTPGRSLLTSTSNSAVLRRQSSLSTMFSANGSSSAGSPQAQAGPDLEEIQTEVCL
jgi:hypothetical protein